MWVDKINVKIYLLTILTHHAHNYNWHQYFLKRENSQYSPAILFPPKLGEFLVSSLSIAAKHYNFCLNLHACFSNNYPNEWNETSLFLMSLVIYWLRRAIPRNFMTIQEHFCFPFSGTTSWTECSVKRFHMGQSMGIAQSHPHW